ncbi:MAG: sugar transferase [Candidatus Omnitrophica bacterium]|nr:sugar transferase [Candidatus Omnitrophota bacterium]
MKNRINRLIILRKYRIALVLLDILFISLSVYIVNAILERPQPSVIFYLGTNIIWLITASTFFLYAAFRYSRRQILLTVITGWLALSLASFYVDALRVGRAALLLMLPFMAVFILGHRILLRGIRSRIVEKDGKRETRVLILGLGEKAKEIAAQIRNDKELNYKLIGFLRPDHYRQQDIKVNRDHVLGGVDELYQIAKREKLDEVIVAFSAYTPLLHKKIEKIMREHSELGLKFKVIPDLYDVLVGRLKVSRVTGYPLLDMLPEVANRRYLGLKRVMDIGTAFLGLTFLSPLMLTIAVILKAQEKGPVFYTQERVGESGQPFILYKFRSMVPDAEKETGPVWAGENDERITLFGRFLRRSSFDELPQLWNVLRGEMSLVGPRPERPHFVHNHKELQGKRLNVKPGMTGLAQINGRYNLTARQKTKYDYIYLKNCSFTLDMMILFRTIDAVFSKRGAR